MGTRSDSERGPDMAGKDEEETTGGIALSRRSVFAGLGLLALAPFLATLKPGYAYADNVGRDFDIRSTKTGQWINNFNRTIYGVPFDLSFMLVSKSENPDHSWTVGLKFYKTVSKPYAEDGKERVWYNRHTYILADGHQIADFGPGYAQEVADFSSITHYSQTPGYVTVREGSRVHIKSKDRLYSSNYLDVGPSYYDFYLSVPIANFRVRFFTGYDPQQLLKTQTVQRGGNATAPADPSRPGYRFLGWDRGYTNIQRDTDVYGRWQPLAKVRYWADGELRYTQENQVPGTPVNVPAEAVSRCRRPGCTPGWTGWFSDSGCSRRWGGGNVPAGTLDLYSYNEATVSFQTTSDSATVDGRFVTAPGGPAIGYPLVPQPRTVRYGRSIGLSLPAPCFRDDGDSCYVTYRPQGYFPQSSGGTPGLSISPQRDTVLYIRWVETIAEGVETTL